MRSTTKQKTGRLAHATANKKRKISQLERLAAELRTKLISVHHPCLIEFSGTPKAGKTSTARSLDLFLRRNDFRVHFIGESGSVSPLSNKKDFKFNVWTAATSLCWLLEAIDKNPEFIIMDRGVFDALAWIQWHSEAGQVTEAERKAMENFYLIPKWRTRVDIVFLMTATPDVALQRESKNLLTAKFGRIMEPTTLQSLLLSFDTAYNKFSKQFRRVVMIDTTDIDSVMCGEIVVRTTLEVLNSGIHC
jgi:thymidylate kinase